MNYSAGTAGALITLIAVLFMTACVPTSPIRDIVDNPRQYAGKTVTIEGTVSAVYSLIVIKYFEVNDGTGVIGVVSEKPLPKKGEHVRVTGELQEAFSLGDKSMTIIFERNDNVPAPKTSP